MGVRKPRFSPDPGREEPGEAAADSAHDRALAPLPEDVELPKDLPDRPNRFPTRATTDEDRPVRPRADSPSTVKR